MAAGNASQITSVQMITRVWGSTQIMHAILIPVSLFVHGKL